MRHNIQTQFLLWFLLLAVLPLAVFTVTTYTNVRTNVEADMQSALAFDLNQAMYVMDERWSNFHRYVQVIANSQELYDVFSTMDRSVKQGEYHTAQFYGIYSLDSQLKSLFATERDIDAAMVLIDGRCVYTYNHFITVNEDFSDDALYGQIVEAPNTFWLSGVENPFHAFDGGYTVIARNIKDVFSGKPSETICTVVLLISQQRLSQSLEEYARFPGSILLMTGSDGGIIAESYAASGLSPAYIEELNGFVRDSGKEISSAFWREYYAVWSRSANSGWGYTLLTPRHHITATSSGIIRTAVGLGICMCVLLVVFLLLVSRTFIVPILRLAAAMKEVGQNNLNVTVKSTSKNEIGEVTRGFNEMVRDLRVLFDLSIEKEKQKREYQIAMLRYQINPHFIHNTLNSIRFTAQKHKDQETADMLVIMSRLLRSTLSNAAALIPFHQELENIKDFLTLLQIRYDNMLRVEYDIAPEALSCMTPSMILQPIVENAVAHGLNEKLNLGEEAVLAITARMEGGLLRLSVCDNGYGIAPEKCAQLLQEQTLVNGNEKIGLANIHNRIRLLVGDAYGLSIDSVEGEYTRVYITLPIHPDATP